MIGFKKTLVEQAAVVIDVALELDAYRYLASFEWCRYQVADGVFFVLQHPRNAQAQVEEFAVEGTDFYLYQAYWEVCRHLAIACH